MFRGLWPESARRPSHGEPASRWSGRASARLLDGASSQMGEGQRAHVLAERQSRGSGRHPVRRSRREGPRTGRGSGRRAAGSASRSASPRRGRGGPRGARADPPRCGPRPQRAGDVRHIERGRGPGGDHPHKGIEGPQITDVAQHPDVALEVGGHVQVGDVQYCIQDALLHNPILAPPLEPSPHRSRNPWSGSPSVPITRASMALPNASWSAARPDARALRPVLTSNALTFVPRVAT